MSAFFFILFSIATFLLFTRAFMHAQHRFANLPLEAPKETWPSGTWILYSISVLIICLIGLWNGVGHLGTDLRGLCYVVILLISFGMGRTELFRLINRG
ncbi:MAG: hypothetical protein V4682_03095 [Patescibacteria group bacterium]